MAGPAGVKQLNEEILHRLSSQLGEIKKLVTANRQSLETIKTRTDRVVATTDAIKRLTGMDEFLQRATLCGLALHFRALLNDALRHVLETRIPFIFGAIADLHTFTDHTPVRPPARLAPRAHPPRRTAALWDGWGRRLTCSPCTRASSPTSIRCSSRPCGRTAVRGGVVGLYGVPR